MSTPKSASISSPIPPFGNPSDCSQASCARDRVFQAARNLFYKHGIRGVSVDTIAAEAGTTKVTLYRVFSSKDDLVVQCLRDHTSRFWQLWAAAVAQHEGHPRKQIEALFEELKSRLCAKEAERGCPMANTAVEIDDDSHPARQIVRDHHAEIARRLRELSREMGARRPEELGDALTLLLEGVFTSRLVSASTEQAVSVCAAAKALLDSPALGAPRS
jgi:AcrR family transcriptional regulator